MARYKPSAKNIYPVADNKAANAALGEIAELKRKIATLEAAMNEEIDRVKAAAEEKVAPLAVRLNAMENGLMVYAENNYDELFTTAKTKEYDFGRLGYRLSSEIKAMPKMTLAQVLGKVKEFGFDAAVRIKESLNKDEMRMWPEERLELVGARRVEKNTFWYEIKEEEIHNN